MSRALLVIDAQNEDFAGALPITPRRAPGDTTGTLPPSESGGKATAEGLQRPILAARAQLISEVSPSSEWIGRL